MLSSPGKMFLIAAIIAWSGIGAAVFAGLRDPAPVTTTAMAAAKFDDRFGDGDEALLKKQDRLPLPVVAREPMPEPVAPVEQAPPSPKLPAAFVMKGDEPVVRRHPHREARDICQRHHMHKVRTGKWGWRCRK
jgi:hypothetical protein